MQIYPRNGGHLASVFRKLKSFGRRAGSGEGDNHLVTEVPRQSSGRRPVRAAFGAALAHPGALAVLANVRRTRVSAQGCTSEGGRARGLGKPLGPPAIAIYVTLPGMDHGIE